MKILDEGEQESMADLVRHFNELMRNAIYQDILFYCYILNGQCALFTAIILLK